MMYKKFLMWSIFVFALRAHAMDDQIITLESLDKLQFQVQVGVAKQSVTLKHLMADAGMDNTVPLPNIKGEVLGKILELLPIVKEVNAGVQDAAQKKKVVIDVIQSLDGPTLIDFIIAVNYLDIPPLLQVGIAVARSTDINKLPPSFLTLPKEIRNCIIYRQAQRILGQVSIKESLIIEGPKIGKGVNKVLVTPDDKKIIAAFNDNYIRVYDRKTAKQIALFRYHNPFCITPDGSRIVQINERGRLQIRDITTQKLLEFNAVLFSNKYISAICVTQDGSKIIVGMDNEIYILDINNGTLIASINIEKVFIDFGLNLRNKIKHYYFRPLSMLSRNNKLIFLIEGIIAELDITTLKITDIFKFPAYNNIFEMYMTLDGSKIICSTLSGLFVLDVRRRKWVSQKQKQYFNSVAVTPDGNKIIASDNPDRYKGTASNDPVIRIFDIKTFEELAALRGHKPNTTHVRVAKDGTKMQSLRSASINSVQVTKDGNNIVSASDDNSVRIWDISIFKLESLIENMSLEQAQKVFAYLKGDHAAGWDGIPAIFGLSVEQGAEPVQKKHKQGE